MLKIEPGREPVVPRDAATVILLRDLEGAGGFEVFFVRRHDRSGFMGGAHVFPGGKLDDADADPRLVARIRGRTPEQAAAALGEDDSTRAAALFVAAVRETFEEAGVLLADVPAGTDLAAARARLEAGTSFAELIDSLDATLRLDALVPWARWVTPEVEPRRFDARFFVARTPPDQRAAHDRHETTAADWMTPRRTLERDDAREIFLPPPTLRNVELLAGHPSSAAVLAAGERARPRTICPVFKDLNGVWALVLPGDPEHPEREPVVAGPTRFVLSEGRWWSGEPRGGMPRP